MGRLKVLRQYVDAELEKSAWVGCKGRCIALLVNLLQGSLCGLVALELNDVDEVLRLHHHVHAPVACGTLHFDVESQHAEEHEEVKTLVES